MLFFPNNNTIIDIDSNRYDGKHERNLFLMNPIDLSVESNWL